MKEYTIKEVSKMLILPKATLRYYDQIGLVVPQRANNRYRYYTEQDVLHLQYTEVLKFSGFTLLEIKEVLDFKRERNISNCPLLLHIMSEKKADLLKRIELYHSMVGFIDQAGVLMKNKKSPSDMAKIDKFVTDVYQTMTEGNNSE